MRPVQILSAVCCCALVSLGGASCSGLETDPNTDVIKAGNSYVLLETEEYTGDVGGQGISGTLALVNGCVGFGSKQDGTVIIFQPGTSVSGVDEDLVITVGERELRIGDVIEAGTRLNESGKAPLTSFGDLGDQAPESCRDMNATPIDFGG